MFGEGNTNALASGGMSVNPVIIIADASIHNVITYTQGENLHVHI